MQKAPFSGLYAVPKVGIEPTLPKEHDFESCASTNSATSAFFFQNPAHRNSCPPPCSLNNLTTSANSGISN